MIEIKKTIIIKLYKIDKVFPNVWKYIENEENWIQHTKGTFIDVDFGEEFFLNEHKSVDEFDKFIEDEKYLNKYFP